MRALAWSACLFVSAVAASFALHRDVLALPFVADDFTFLLRCTTWTLADFCAQFNPYHIGWYYRPTFLVYWWASLQLFGPDPVALHAVGLLIHAGNITLLALLVYRLRRSVPLALLCAALALIWPGQRGEMGALDWISAHSALLVLYFSLLTIHLWLWFRATNARWVYGAALVCLWLALTSKEDANSLPLALLIFDGLLCRRSAPQPLMAHLKPALPFVAVYLCYLALDITAYRHYRALDPDVGQFLVMPLSTRLALMFSVWNIVTLKALYFSLPDATVMHGVAGAIMVALAVALRRDGSALAFYLWGLAAVVPMPLAIAYEALQTRFLYLPTMIAATMAGVLVSANWAGRAVAALVGWSLLSITAPVVVGMILWLPAQLSVWCASVAVFVLAWWLKRRVGAMRFDGRASGRGICGCIDAGCGIRTKI